MWPDPAAGAPGTLNEVQPLGRGPRDRRIPGTLQWGICGRGVASSAHAPSPAREGWGRGPPRAISCTVVPPPYLPLAGGGKDIAQNGFTITKDDDADHQQRRALVGDAVEALGARVAVLGEILDPLRHLAVHRRHRQHEHELRMQPVLPAEADIAEGEPEPEDPGDDHRRRHDRLEQPPLHHLEGLGLRRAGRGLAMIDHQPAQIEQPRHPGDDGEHMKRLQPEIHGRCFSP